MKIKLVLTALFICLLLIFSQPLKAQDDAGVWSSLGVEKDLNQRLKLELSGHFRGEEGLGIWGSYFSEAELDFKLNSSWRTELEWRNVYNNDYSGARQGTERWQRLRLNLKSKHKVPHGIFRTRLGVQDLFFLNDLAGTAGQTYRFLASYEYKIKNWQADPEIFTEYFLQERNQDVDEFRIGLSTSFDAFGGKLSIRGFWEDRLRVGEVDLWVFDIGYRIGI